MRDYIGKLIQGNGLSENEMKDAMGLMLSGSATPGQAAAFLTALRIKGETVDEIAGALKGIRSNGPLINVNGKTLAIDRDEINVDAETILSTASGSNGSTKTFNVSTATAFVAAGAGMRVVRYGTRVASRLCGSADVLEQLGINLHLNSSDIQRCMEETGLGFFYPPITMGPMGNLYQLRQEMGIRTILNLVGPICNPADAKAQMVGVYRPELTEKLAQALNRLGTKAALVVHGEGALDEISVCGESRISHLSEGKVHTFTITPEELGLKRASLEDVGGGNAGKNASLIKNVLEGEKGARRDMVILNAAACFFLMEMDSSISGGISRAEESIDSGRALERLKDLSRFTNSINHFVRKEII